jgi:hypothetical protein
LKKKQITDTEQKYQYYLDEAEKIKKELEKLKMFEN